MKNGGGGGRGLKDEPPTTDQVLDPSTDMTDGWQSVHIDELRGFVCLSIISVHVDPGYV